MGTSPIRKLDALAFLFVLLCFLLGVIWLVDNGPVAIDTLPLLEEPAEYRHLGDVVGSPLLGSFKGFDAGPFWRPLSNTYYLVGSLLYDHFGLPLVYLLGVSAHLTSSLFAFLILRWFFGVTRGIWGSLVFLVHPLSSDVLPAIARHQDVMGTLVILLGSYLVLIRREYLGIIIGVLPVFFKELYILVPLAFAGVLLRDLLEKWDLSIAAVLVFSVLSPMLVFVLRTTAGIGSPSIGMNLDDIGWNFLRVGGAIAKTLPFPFPQEFHVVNAYLPLLMIGSMAACGVYAIARPRTIEVILHGIWGTASRDQKRGFILSSLLIVFIAVPPVGVGYIAPRSMYSMVFPFVFLMFFCLRPLSLHKLRMVVIMVLTCYSILFVKGVGQWHSCDAFWNTFAEVVSRLDRAARHHTSIHGGLVKGENGVPGVSCLDGQTYEGMARAYEFRSWKKNDDLSGRTTSVRVLHDVGIQRVTVDASQ